MKKQKCSKCGSDDIGTSYHDGKGSHYCGYCDFAKSDNPHLHYYCRNCRYDWIGKTKDQEYEKGN